MELSKWDKAQKVVGTLAPIMSLCIVISWYSYLLYKDRKAAAALTNTVTERKDVPPIMP